MALAISAPGFGHALAAAETAIRSADPSVIHTQDGYVAVEARNGQAIYVRMATQLAGLAEAKAVRIWSDREGLGEVWAPEIVRRNGSFEIYFTAGAGSSHRMYRIVSAEPASSYGDATEIVLPDDKWAIDGLPFTFLGNDYFLWSGWQGNRNLKQDLFIAAMSSTGEVEGPRIRIGTTDRQWENIAREEPGIIEGPQPIVDPASQLHVVYSANGSWGENYCLADLRLKSGGDPLDAADWAESPGCLFGANAQTLADGVMPTTQAKGVGHNSFVLPDGNVEASAISNGPQPFLYHGVPADDEPENFWEARLWFTGTFQWTPGIAYRAGPSWDTGWGLSFNER